jgi:HEAT repeat protein
MRAESGHHRHLKVAIPLLVALILSGVFAFLLFHHVGEDPTPPPPAARESPVALGDLPLPYGPPSARDPFQWPKKIERYGGEYPRWNLTEFPRGWDHGLARSLHSFFEAMEVNRDSDADKLAGLDQARKDLADFLAGLGPEAVPTLAAILNAEGDFVDRRFLLKALGDLGPQTEEATFVLRDFFLARVADVENRSELLHCVDAMGRLQNDTSYEVLKELTGRDDLHSYRHNLVEVLSDHPRREEAIGMLVGIMHGDQVNQARNKAARALGKIQSPSTLGELYAAVEREPYWVNKQTMLGSIGKIGDPSSVPFLEQTARSAKEPAVRLSAGGALRRIGTPHAVGVLQDLARSEPDPSTRKHFQDWAGKAGQ